MICYGKTKSSILNAGDINMAVFIINQHAFGQNLYTQSLSLDASINPGEMNY